MNKKDSRIYYFVWKKGDVKIQRKRKTLRIVSKKAE